MKRAGLYILLVGFVCVYMTMNMGFGVHRCSKDGTSKIMLLTREMPCSCNHHDKEQDNGGRSECCRNSNKQDEPDDRCCETLLCVLDTEQTVAECVQVEAQTPVWTVAPQTTAKDLCIFCQSTTTAFHAAGIVLGPDGGLDSIIPLRL